MTTVFAYLERYVVIYEVEEAEVTEIVTAIKAENYKSVEIVRTVKALGS